MTLEAIDYSAGHAEDLFVESLRNTDRVYLKPSYLEIISQLCLNCLNTRLYAGIIAMLLKS